MNKTVLAMLLAPLALWSTAALAGTPVDAFFDGMAIAVKPGQQARFVVGDNLDGYLEAYTQSTSRGEGYVTRSGTLYHGYTTAVDGAVNPRASSREAVLPYGHQVRYPGGVREQMALLSKQHALALRVTSTRAATLSITPRIADGGAVSRMDDVVIVAPVAPATTWLALAADQPFSVDAGVSLRTRQRARSFTVVLGFGASAEEATQRARQLAATDPIQTERARLYQELTRSQLTTSDAAYNKALNWAKASSRMFVVEEFGTGIWAGLPWFRDNWGRDSFIALPGTLLVSGQFAQAKAVLENFARYQNLKQPRDKDYGRVPNRVSAGDIIYNTVDGTPWMLREALEYIRYTGDQEFARQMVRLAVPYFDGAIANYMTPDGLLSHDAADTWMDARIDNQAPWSARGPKAVEIQALWFTALQTGAWLAAQAGDTAHAIQWNGLAERARASFLAQFWDGHVMADRLRADGSRDTRVRPNQLMLATIPLEGDFVAPSVQAAVIHNAVSELLYPYGIASLSQNDPLFHPRHENPAYHHKDAAYHNGTIWGWNAGFTVTALNKFGYQDLAWPLTQNLGQQILGLGTLGSMSELLDALPHEGGQLKPSGTYAQSWSVAEYARNAYQDYVGFRPNLLQDTLAFTPAVPRAWSHFEARLPYGADEHLMVRFTQRGLKHDLRQRWQLALAGSAPRTLSFDYLKADLSRARVAFRLRPGQTATLTLGAGEPRLNGRILSASATQPSFAQTIGTLRFQTPKPYRPQDFPMLRGKDVLKGLIERNEIP